MLKSEPSAVRGGTWWLLLTAAVVVLDQLTKYLTVHYIEYGTFGIEVLPFFNLIHIYNYGAAFSFLAEGSGWQRWMFSAIAVIISLILAQMLRKTPASHRWTCAAYALFIGGALGNLIDRVFLGYVVDFLLFYIKSGDFFWAYPAFNVADIAVCVGAGLLIVIALFSKHKDKA